MLCDDIIEQGYFNIVTNILNQAAVDYKSGNEELKKDVSDFLESSWFDEICNVYNLNPELWKKMIYDDGCGLNKKNRNKLILMEYR